MRFHSLRFHSLRFHFLRFISRFIATAIGTLLAFAAHAQAPSLPKVDNAWVRPTVAGQTAGGGFLTITGSGSPDVLISAVSDAAQSVEIHTMTMDGNVMRMRRISGIDVAAGQKIELKPGGMHIMFMGLREPLVAGTTIPLMLRFKEGGDVRLNMLVTATPPGGAAAAAAMPAQGEHKH